MFKHQFKYLLLYWSMKSCKQCWCVGLQRRGPDKLQPGIVLGNFQWNSGGFNGNPFVHSRFSWHTDFNYVLSSSLIADLLRQIALFRMYRTFHLVKIKAFLEIMLSILWTIKCIIKENGFIVTWQTEIQMTKIKKNHSQKKMLSINLARGGGSQWRESK